MRKTLKKIAIDISMWVGIVSAVLGLCFAIWIIYNYKSITWLAFSETDGIDKLATVLVGTAGLLFTFSGVIFLGYTLYQTRIEMTDTRDIMNLQLSESTFFNLLKHHRELVHSMNKDIEENTQSFKQEIASLKNHLVLYKSNIEGAKFESFDEMQYTPHYQYVKLQKVRIVGKSLINMINLIATRLKSNESFFHETLYYNLNDDERFLIGLISSYNAEEKLLSVNYNYKEYFAKFAHFYIPANEEVPLILIDRVKIGSLVLPNVELKTFSRFSEEIIKNTSVHFFSDKKPAKITYSITKLPESIALDYFLQEFEVKLDIVKSKLQLYEFFKDAIFFHLKEFDEMEFTLIFYFDFGDKIYSVKYWPITIKRKVIDNLESFNVPYYKNMMKEENTNILFQYDFYNSI